MSAAAVPDRLLTAPELAEILSVPETWVREHTRSGLIPHVELGRYRRYRLERVLAWLEQQEAGGASWRKHQPRAPA
jgi:excisionase family DNA binding protein